MRGAVWALLFALLAVLPGGCSSFDMHADLAENDRLYRDVAFTTRAPGERQVFVTPLRDVRDASKRPIHERGFPIRYGTDEFWERPVTQMVGDVLARELEVSELFGEVVERAGPDTLILQPSIEAFAVGSKEAMAGSSTFADVALRIVIHGPVGKDGNRPKWHDRVYANRQSSAVGIKPMRPYLMIGRALQLTIAQALHAIDGSNVARLHVPVQLMLGEAKEASAPK